MTKHMCIDGTERDENTLKKYFQNILATAEIHPRNKDIYSAWVDVKYLSVDPTYQTLTRQNRKSDLSNTDAKGNPIVWDDRLCGDILISLREDFTAVILDGCHRSNAALKLHIPTLRAKIYLNLTLDQEIDLFVRQQDSNIPLDARERWLAFSANPERYIRIAKANEIMKTHGFGVLGTDAESKASTLYDVDCVSRILDDQVGRLKDDDYYEWMEWMFNLFDINNWDMCENTTRKSTIEGFKRCWKKRHTKQDFEQATINLNHLMARYDARNLMYIAHKEHPGVINDDSCFAKLIAAIADGSFTIEHASGYDNYFKTMGMEKTV